jgi:MFS family permease
VPTGVLADLRGRRYSYLLGAATLLVSTLLYLFMWQTHAALLGWAVASVLLGLGFTFFSGATEAWLVDALAFSGFEGKLDDVFAKGQTVSGVAMLAGSISGGYVAQITNLGTPYILRSVLLGLTFVTAFVSMHDLGFTPARGKGPLVEIRRVARASIDQGWRRPPIRWLMLSAPFSTGVAIYGFYALQPYFLELYGDSRAFGIAGLSASIVAGTQILGGLSVPLVQRCFARRTQILLIGSIVGVGCLALIGATSKFAVAVAAVVVWAMAFSAMTPVRQAYLNGLLQANQRATVISFDNLFASAGGVVSQPALGRIADVYGYSASYFVTAAIELLSLPFLVLARRENAPSDPIEARADVPT